VTSQAIVVDSAVPAARRTVRFDSALLLSGAMVVSGILTYAFQILAARTLGAGAFGQIAALWGGVFLLAIVVFRPLEQTLSRSIANRLAHGQEIRSVLRSVGIVSAGACAVIAVAAVFSWTTVTQRLFHGDAFMTAMLVVGVAGYGASYLVRGLLGGVRWFTGYAVALLADGIGRLAVAAPLLLVASPHIAGVAIASAGVAGAVAPFLWARRWLPALRGGAAGEPFDSRGALRFAAPASVAAGADQLLINGAPLLVILLGTGGTAEAGVVFAATMLVRAPVYVFTGVAASLLPNFTLLDRARRQELAAVFGRTVRILVAAGVAIVLGVGVFGPTAMNILYGAGFDVTRLDLVLLGASVGLYLASATFLQILLAFDRGRSVALAWLGAAAALVCSYLALPMNEVERVSIALVVATALNAVLHGALLLTLLRSRASDPAEALGQV
jgi:O-antigen/teichoic acid export membrane protein